VVVPLSLQEIGRLLPRCRKGNLRRNTETGDCGGLLNRNSTTTELYLVADLESD
jgi:hypothetical protein